MNKKKSIASALFLLSTFLCISQDMSWQWASFATSKDYNRNFGGVKCGYHNVLYTSCRYDKFLQLGDTILSHPEIANGTNSNCAIALYTMQGDYLDVVDLHTVHGAHIYNPYTGVDREDNLYVSATFQEQAIIQDTVIFHCNTPFYELPDGFLVKLDRNLNISWVRTIGGTLSDQVYGMYVEDNGDIYIISDHVAGTNPTTVIDFFQQDTVITPRGFTAICKLDKDGILDWRLELVGGISSIHLTPGKDSLLYLWGISNSDIIVNNDTIIEPSTIALHTFFGYLDKHGNLRELDFVEFPAIPKSFTVDHDGNYFMSADIQDTLVIGQDTTVVPSGLTYRMIGKFDTLFQPFWYHVVPSIIGQQMGSIGFKMDGVDLAFCSYTNNDIVIDDTIIELTGNNEVFVGIFDEYGHLKDITVSNTSGAFLASGLLIDKCKNFVLPGYLAGTIYLEDDTASTYAPWRYDAALVRVVRNQPAAINLGPDTAGCESYLLDGPPGYCQYSLNDSLMDGNSCLITETGNYIFGCSDEGCWVYDTIFIEIQQGFSIDLGSDTSLLLSDSLVISIPGTYDSVRWFDGTVTSTKVIYGTDYPPGSLPVWVDVFSGACSARDTLMLQIIDDSGLEELHGTGIMVFPNPFRDELTIQLPQPVREICLMDYLGNVRYVRNVEQGIWKITVNLHDLNAGIYLLRVTTIDDATFIRRVIKAL